MSRPQSSPDMIGGFFDVDKLSSTEIPSTSNKNDYAFPSLPPSSVKLDRLRRSSSREPFMLDNARHTLIIKSANATMIPFIIEGGAENSQLIYVGQVLSIELMGQLGYGDVIFAIDDIKVVGRVLSEVSAFFHTLFNAGDDIYLEYFPAGSVPIDIREILRNASWSSLQSVIRENIFLRVVPCTTRVRKADEINGENYHFVSLRHFLKLLRHGAFLEHASFDGYLYGTPRPEIDVRDYDADDAVALNIRRAHSEYEASNSEHVELNTLSEMSLQTDSRGPLPPNWEAAYSENGEKYFIDHNTGTTQWEDPRDETSGDSKSMTTISDTSTPTTIAAAPSASTTHSPPNGIRLPPGWERVDDEVHGTFYVDHINKRTQYEPPPQFHDSAIPKNGDADKSTANGMITNGSSNYYQQQHQLQQQQQQLAKQKVEMSNGAATTSTNFYDTHSVHHVRQYTTTNGCSNVAHDNSYNHDVEQLLSNGNGVYASNDTSITTSAGFSNGTPVWQHDRSVRQNGYDKSAATSTGVDPSFYTYSQTTHKQRVSIPYIFVNDVNQLRGEILTTVIQKGTNGLGFTLIGNDGSNKEPEFIQIKTILPNGPAARNGMLEPGDVLVFVNDDFMLGASQEDACCAFRAIPPGESVRVQVCRGYPYPASKIYTVSTNFQNRSRDNIEINLTKGQKGFGFTITDSLQGQRVKTILYPDHCANLMEGDLILEVGNENVRTIAHKELVDMLQNFRPGTRLRMLVSRNTGRHRSRTPTAGFRYGEQRPSANVVVAPRSKTPAPTSLSNNGVGGRLNGANAAALNRNNVFQQQQQQQRPVSTYDGAGLYWNTTMPKTSRQDQPIYGDIRKYQQQQNGFVRPKSGFALNPQMRTSSSSLGFSSTPNYIPATVLGANGQNHTDWQYIVVNLIEKDGGFGFHLLSDEQSSPLIVGPIVPGGAARLDGRLQPGDEIIEIDGQPAMNFNYTTAVNAIKAATKIGHVKLVIKRRKESNLYSTGVSPITTNASNGLVGNESSTMMRLKQQVRGASQQRLYDVHLAKLEHEDFGITIISHNYRYIGSIDPQSPAARCGLLRTGDCLAAMNGYPVADMSHQQVLNFLRSSGNTITLTIDPGARMPSVAMPFNTPNGDEIDSLVSMMAAATNGTLRSNGTATVNYGTLTKTASLASGEAETFLNVTLSRGTKGFGFSIRGGMEFNEMPIFVLRIADDGPAAMDGRLRVGDQLVQINGENTVGMTHERAIQLITLGNAVRLVVARKS